MITQSVMSTGMSNLSSDSVDLIDSHRMMHLPDVRYLKASIDESQDFLLLESLMACHSYLPVGVAKELVVVAHEQSHLVER